MLGVMSALYLALCLLYTWRYVCSILGVLSALYLALCLLYTWCYVCSMLGVMSALCLVLCLLYAWCYVCSMLGVMSALCLVLCLAALYGVICLFYTCVYTDMQITSETVFNRPPLHLEYQVVSLFNMVSTLFSLKGVFVCVCVCVCVCVPLIQKSNVVHMYVCTYIRIKILLKLLASSQVVVLSL